MAIECGANGSTTEEVFAAINEAELKGLEAAASAAEALVSEGNADNSADEAAASANQASNSADEASASASQANASANFKGEWNSSTAYAMPSSVYLNGYYYNALVNNTNKNPETNTSIWAVASIIPSGNRNVLISGGFDIWQMGGVFPEVFTGSNIVTYTADRWYQHQPNGTAKVYQGGTSSPTVADEFRGTTFVHDVITGGSLGEIGQNIENVRTLSGKKVTVSFWVNGVTNAKTFDVRLRQNFGTDGSGQVIGSAQNATADFGVWKKITLTFDVPSVQGKTIGSGSYLQLEIRSGVIAGRVDFGNIQLEAGEVATDFEQRPIGTELNLCRRYARSYNTAKDVGDLAYEMREEPTLETVSGVPFFYDSEIY